MFQFLNPALVPIEQIILLLGNILGPLIHAGSSLVAASGAAGGVF